MSPPDAAEDAPAFTDDLYTEAPPFSKEKGMSLGPKKPNRAPRSDAAANRERIIEVAGAMFRAGERTVSLEAVAKRAGVGIGTLYRHFASRDALAAVIYHREVEELVALAGASSRNDDAVAALREWLRATVDFVATKKGMADALSWSARMPADLATYTSDRLTGAVERLLCNALRDGRSQTTITAQELLRVLVALCYEFEDPDWQARVVALLDIFLDGLLSTS